MARQTFRLFIILTMVISRRKNQWYIVSQLLLKQNIWQAWLLVFLPPKLSVLLKIIFFISLITTKISSKIQISEGDVCHVTYSFKIMLFISTGIYDDKLRPQILSVVPTTNAPLIEVVTKAGLTVWQRNDISCITRNMSLIFIIWHWWENICFPMWQWCNPDVTYFLLL